MFHVTETQIPNYSVSTELELKTHGKATVEHTRAYFCNPFLYTALSVIVVYNVELLDESE
jgi:hypothetical protein